MRSGGDEGSVGHFVGALRGLSSDGEREHSILEDLDPYPATAPPTPTTPSAAMSH